MSTGLIQNGRPVAPPPAGYRPLKAGEIITSGDYKLWVCGSGPWASDRTTHACAGKPFDPGWHAWVAVPGHYERGFTNTDEGGVV